MLIYALLGVAVAAWLPVAAGVLAFCGRWMLFIYASHSFVLAPLYGGWNPHWLWNVWVPLLVIPLLAWVGKLLQSHFPRVMSVMLARRCR